MLTVIYPLLYTCIISDTSVDIHVQTHISVPFSFFLYSQFLMLIQASQYTVQLAHRVSVIYHKQANRRNRNFRFLRSSNGNEVFNEQEKKSHFPTSLPID